MRKGKRFEFASRPQCRNSVTIVRPFHTRLTQTMSFVDPACSPCEPSTSIAPDEAGRMIDEGPSVPH
jgi:hypothetical protein